MKNYKFYQTEFINDKLFDYPCVDSNNKYLTQRKALLINTNGYVDHGKLCLLGADVVMNPSNAEMAFPNIGIIAPIEVTEEEDRAYYQILDYYIHTLQQLIHKMIASEGFKHIVVLLPYESDTCHSDFVGMANYAVYGLIQGLGEMYASKRIFVNGIVVGKEINVELITEWTAFLASDNACNIVGQVIVL